MTLGSGIFLSSLLLGLILLFWITEDRWRWSRIFLWLVGGLAAIGGAVYLFTRYKVLPTKQFATRIWSSVFGLHDGSGEEEVIARLGEPTSAAVSGTTKRMVYEPLNVMFYLTKRNVYMIYVTAHLPQ